MVNHTSTTREGYSKAVSLDPWTVINLKTQISKQINYYLGIIASEKVIFTLTMVPNIFL